MTSVERVFRNESILAFICNHLDADDVETVGRLEQVNRMLHRIVRGTFYEPAQSNIWQRIFARTEMTGLTNRGRVVSCQSLPPPSHDLPTSIVSFSGRTPLGYHTFTISYRGPTLVLRDAVLRRRRMWRKLDLRLSHNQWTLRAVQERIRRRRRQATLDRLFASQDW